MQGLHGDLRPAGYAAREVVTDSGRLSVWDRPGDGAPLLLIHGNSASKVAFADLMIQPALHGRRVVALDLPGCGESNDACLPQVQYTIPAMARTVVAAAGQLLAEAPVLLGWSLGGHVGIEAAGYGMPMQALVLTGTPPCGPGPDELAASFQDNEVMAVTFMEDPPEPMLRAYVEALYGDRRRPREAFFADARRADGRLRSTVGAHWAAGGDGFHQRSVMASWDRPVAVLQGEEDPFIRMEVFDGLAWKRLWRGAVQRLPAGHAPFYETPALFAQRLGEFLKDIDA